MPAKAGDTGSNSWVEKIPFRRKWLPIAVFLPGKLQGQGHKRVQHNLATKQQQEQYTFKVPAGGCRDLLLQQSLKITVLSFLAY